MEGRLGSGQAGVSGRCGARVTQAGCRGRLVEGWLYQMRLAGEHPSWDGRGEGRGGNSRKRASGRSSGKRDGRHEQCT